MTQAANAIRRALIVIDVQQEYFSGALPITHPPVSTSMPNIARAMDAAHASGIPVIVVQHSLPAGAPAFAPGSESWALHPEVAQRPADLRFEKNLPSAFAGTSLDAWLRDHQINTLVVAGYMTHNCNASTVFEAFHTGYSVEVLSDATGALAYMNAAGSASAEEIHRVFSVVFHSNFAAVASTAQWLDAVAAGLPLQKDNVPASNQRARAVRPCSITS
ncbi:cysteine hydrolase [Aquabacterium soli]|uniref:Cysteine hydrolase n=1 Tax=Aquabacterium soli TaxID=2493092 RepID=A0A3R8T6X1_9BURK|nr:cysteine hydrolase family protein [Aquabacterium soli]RRS05500.1 cysteine hydrolase [Aquabacterium soli]